MNQELKNKLTGLDLSLEVDRCKALCITIDYGLNKIARKIR